MTRKTVRSGRLSELPPSEQVVPPDLAELHIPSLRIAAPQADPDVPEIEAPKVSERPLTAVNEHGEEIGEYSVRLHPKKEKEILKLTRMQADGDACILCGHPLQPLISIGVCEVSSTVLVKCEGRCRR